MSTTPKPGEVYGCYQVIEEAPTLYVYKEDGTVAYSRRQSKCRCLECGEVSVVTNVNLTHNKNKHCKYCRYENVEKKDISNQRFGHLTALYRTQKKYRQQFVWHCVCDCGNEIDVKIGALTSNNTKSCGKCGLSRLDTLVAKVKAFIGKRFGRLTVLAFDRVENKKTYVKCKCDCGKEFTCMLYSIKSGNTTSCGCTRSRGEREVSDYLTRKNIEYKREKTFDDLRGPGGGRLRFDFCVEQDDKTFLIEYQGKQHYEKCEFSIENFGDTQREVTDGIKKEYCAKNNYIYVEIPYYKSVSKILDAYFK